MKRFGSLLLLALCCGALLTTTGCKHCVDPDEPVEPNNPDFGNALHLDGEHDYIFVPHAESLTLSNGSYTIEAWVRPGNHIYYRWIAAKAVNNGKIDYLLGFDRGGQFRFITGGLQNDLYGSYPQPDQWYHVAGVQDLSQGKAFLYVNGVLEASADLTGVSGGNEAPLLLGVRTHTDFPEVLAEYLDGDIDDIRLWNKALSQTEIQARRFQPLAGTEHGLVAYWKFDEPDGTTVLDATDHGHTGSFGFNSAPDRIRSTVPVQ